MTTPRNYLIIQNVSRWCLSGQLKSLPTEVYILLWVLDWHDHIHNGALSREWAAADVSSLSAIILSLGQKHHGPCTLQSRYLPTGVNMCAVCFLLPRECLWPEWLSDLYTIMWKTKYTMLVLHIQSHWLGQSASTVYFFSLFQASVSCSIELVQPSLGSLTVRLFH